VELQVDNFGDWSKSKEWMKTSPEFAANPIGMRSWRTSKSGTAIGRQKSRPVLPAGNMFIAAIWLALTPPA
jgi:hypothetical protein